jgi:hypothetical protein
MNQQTKREYGFLDSAEDRQKLLDEMARVRREVLQVVETTPSEQLYKPQYHGWTLAAMLGHLHLSDNLGKLNIQLGLLGISPPISSTAYDGFNDVMALIFQKRVVETTVQGIQKNEARLADFILGMPVGKFSQPVYAPRFNRYLTVEQAMQEFFYFHWEDHLKTLQPGSVEDTDPEESEDPNLV